MTGKPEDPDFLIEGRQKALEYLSGCGNGLHQSVSAISYKTHAPDVSGQMSAWLWFSQTSLTSAAAGWAALDQDRLTRLIPRQGLDYAAEANELACARRHSSDPVPPAQAWLHAAVPQAWVLFARPLPLLILAAAPQASARLRELLGGRLPVVSYALPGLARARALAEGAANVLSSKTGSIGTGALWLEFVGLLAWGETALEAAACLAGLTAQAEQELKTAEVVEPSWPSDVQAGGSSDYPSSRIQLADLRRQISQAAGSPLLLSCTPDLSPLGLQQVPSALNQFRLGPPDEDTLLRCGPSPINTEGLALAPGSVEPGSLPHLLIDRQLGLISVGHNPSEALDAHAAARQALATLSSAARLGEYQPMPGNLVAAAESAALKLAEANGPQKYAAPAVDPSGELAGEVALITGAASGIGKACVEALLERGAAVIALDINPAIEQREPSPAYLGMICDLTDEAAFCNALEKGIALFGGLDMLVLNAGIFPKGCRVESLKLEDWQKVMHINLDSNLTVLRECYPLLKRAPKGGRVVVNGSRNVPAPGPGAAAYSASKAALTQLARVVALEWGSDHITINTIHPHAVFDTGIWTEEVLKSRATNYGMTIEQYKTNNILHTELTSRDVAELVATMCGPVFRKITGAQIPIDGGSDRVI